MRIILGTADEICYPGCRQNPDDLCLQLRQQAAKIAIRAARACRAIRYTFADPERAVNRLYYLEHRYRARWHRKPAAAPDAGLSRQQTGVSQALDQLVQKRRRRACFPDNFLASGSPGAIGTRQVNQDPQRVV